MHALRVPLYVRRDRFPIQEYGTPTARVCPKRPGCSKRVNTSAKDQQPVPESMASRQPPCDPSNQQRDGIMLPLLVASKTIDPKARVDIAYKHSGTQRIRIQKGMARGQKRSQANLQVQSCAILGCKRVSAMLAAGCFISVVRLPPGYLLRGMPDARSAEQIHFHCYSMLARRFWALFLFFFRGGVSSQFRFGFSATAGCDFAARGVILNSAPRLATSI